MGVLIVADYLPKFTPGAAITCSASAAVTGGRLVVVTGNRLIGPADDTSSARVIGVAGFDAPAGESVTVYTRGSGVHPLTAGAAIAAGDKVTSAAAGKVATATAGVDVLGVALEAATTDLDVIDVLFV
jgi:predicted RecA/RadA family phage recombinase